MGLSPVRPEWRKGSGTLVFADKLFDIDRFRERGNHCLEVYTY